MKQKINYLTNQLLYQPSEQKPTIQKEYQLPQ